MVDSRAAPGDLALQRGDTLRQFVDRQRVQILGKHHGEQVATNMVNIFVGFHSMQR